MIYIIDKSLLYTVLNKIHSDSSDSDKSDVEAEGP